MEQRHLSSCDFVVVGYDRFLGRHKVSSLVLISRHKHLLQENSYLQQYVFFLAEGIERTVFDTRDKDDVIHANPGYLFNGETWGISAGDLTAGANAFAQMLYIGGDGEDVIFGGASSDVIVGDASTKDSANNWIAGYAGDDILRSVGHRSTLWATVCHRSYLELAKT